jgi:hypothetical protein
MTLSIMRELPFVAQNGMVIRLKEYFQKDLIPTSFIVDNLDNKTIKSYFKNPDIFGRVMKRMAYAIGSDIIRIFMRKVVDRLMEGDRLFFNKNVYLYIGNLKPPHVCKNNKALLATRGKRFGLKLVGFEHEYQLRMPSRRRVELKERIENGQRYAL